MKIGRFEKTKWIESGQIDNHYADRPGFKLAGYVRQPIMFRIM